MIVKEKLVFDENVKLDFQSEEVPSFAIINKNNDLNVTRLVISSLKSGDVDIYLNLKERNLLCLTLGAALVSSNKIDKGFCSPMLAPQAGDEPDTIVDAYIVVVFMNQIFGILIDAKDCGGVQIWLGKTEMKEFVESLK